MAEVNQTLMALYQSLIQSGADVPPLIRFNLGRLYEDKQLWQDAILEFQQSAKHSDFQEKERIGNGAMFSAHEETGYCGGSIGEFTVDGRIQRSALSSGLGVPSIGEIR